MGVGFVPPPGRRCLPLRGNCAHSGRGFPLSGDEVCAPFGARGDFPLENGMVPLLGDGVYALPGVGVFLSGNEMRPPFLFLPAGEKETRICALRAALRAVALRNAAAAAGARGWGCTPISFVEMHPPLLFLHARRKRRAPCSVEKKKRTFAANLRVTVPLFCRADS